MLSAKSTTMTMIGVEIVLACTAFIASFSILCAQLQSTSAYKDKQKPRFMLINFFFFVPKKLGFLLS